MASCHPSFPECERLYIRVVRTGDPQAYMRLCDHAVANLSRQLGPRYSPPVPPWQLEDLSEAGFTRAALVFERIPSWGKAFCYARKVAVSLLKRAAAMPPPPQYLDDHPGDPADPKSLAFLSVIEFEDFLQQVGQLIDATDAAHIAYLVRTALLGAQDPAALAAELGVSERTVERHRPRILRKLAILLHDMT